MNYLDRNEFNFEPSEKVIEAIKNFDRSDYNRRLNEFFDCRIGNLERGEAAKSLALWMRSHTSK